MSIRILLADDHKIVREGLRSLLQEEPGMEVVGEASDGRTAVQLAAKLSPEVVVMDIAMPDMNGIEATRQIVERCPGVKVIALSMYCDKGFIGKMLSAGAAGYLQKDSAFRDLVRAVRAVTTKGTYLSPVIASIVKEDYVSRLSDKESVAAPALTAREREVLQLIAEGRSAKGIAARLHISARTVEWHRNRIMEKLRAHSVAQLTKYAIREGLTSIDFH